MGPSFRRGPDPLEQGLDRLVSAGKQLVDGVAGARLGSRPAGSRPLPRGGTRRGGSRLRLDELGRWVEDKLDWILDDEDEWREPWQDQVNPAAAAAGQPLPRRQPLEAISRRTSPRPAAPTSPAALASSGDWPDDASFSVPRWQRPAQPQRPPGRPGEAIASPEAPPPSENRPDGRPLPRSSRRRG
ncbi:MAG: hypothetical protein ACKO7Z_10960 [Cyanobacteriota bacterium]